jgi:hypothetical protein
MFGRLVCRAGGDFCWTGLRHTDACIPFQVSFRAGGAVALAGVFIALAR